MLRRTAAAAAALWVACLDTACTARHGPPQPQPPPQQQPPQPPPPPAPPAPSPPREASAEPARVAPPAALPSALGSVGTFCPATRPVGGQGEMQNPGVAGTGAEPLAQTVRGAAAGWTRTTLEVAHAGVAGRQADSADATFARAGAQAQLSLLDMIRRCTCAPGTGRAVLASEGRSEPGATRTEVTLPASRLPAVVTRAGNHVALRMWVADRCAVGIDLDPATPALGDPSAALIALADAAIDMPALTALCQRR